MNNTPIVKVKSENDTVTILTGSALPQREPNIIDISGVIDTPLMWLENKSIDLRKAHLLVNYDERTITLIVDERDHYHSTVKGSLTLSQEYINFGINNGDYRTPLELANFFKMNRAFFENRSEAMKLVSELTNFKAKVNTEVEDEINQTKGNRKLLLNKAVESNMPETFKIQIPLFKGSKPSTLEVETYFNPDDLTATLVSADAAEQVEDVKREAIDEVVEQIQESYEGLAIIKQ